jgi:hypothetical protein
MDLGKATAGSLAFGGQCRLWGGFDGASGMEGAATLARRTRAECWRRRRPRSRRGCGRRIQRCRDRVRRGQRRSTFRRSATSAECRGTPARHVRISRRDPSCVEAGADDDSGSVGAGGLRNRPRAHFQPADLSSPAGAFDRFYLHPPGEPPRHPTTALLKFGSVASAPLPINRWIGYATITLHATVTVCG